MGRADNPREMSDDTVITLLAERLCPYDMGELDDLGRCRECGRDTAALHEKMLKVLTRR